MTSPAFRTDLPEPDAFTQPYWDAAAEGRLLLRHCADCGRTHHYPREFCPFCWSEAGSWVDASGRAALYTWSVVHSNDLPPFRDRVPYIAAVVDLAEGPRLMTVLVGCEPTELQVDMELLVDFVAFDGGPAVPVFRPAASDARAATGD